MKIGLVRHFKVITEEKPFLNSTEFSKAMLNYDVAPVMNNNLRINEEDWDVCYCSSLPRAITTAETIYKKEIIKTDLLKEVPISPFTKINIKMPSFFWHVGARIAWYNSHKSQQEDINATIERAEKVYNILLNSGYNKILIVAHGYFLHMFNRELKKKGFIGNVETNIKNAKLYTINN